MTTGKNGGGSRLFSALASRLGIVETEVFQEGIHQVREYRGLGLTFRRKTVASSQTLDGRLPSHIDGNRHSGNPPSDGNMPSATNGHTPGHASEHSKSLSSLSSHLGADDSETDAEEAELDPLEGYAPAGADGETELLAFAAHVGSTLPSGATSTLPAPATSGAGNGSGTATSSTATEHLKADSAPAKVDNAPAKPDAAVAETADDAAQQETERPANERHPVLAGKTVAVIGFSGDAAALLGSALAAQYCSFLILGHEEAEFKKGSTSGCDLLMMQARPEWGEPGVLYPGSALKTKRPALIMGGRDALSAVALWTHGGPREFIPAPWAVEDAIWRAATLLVRIEASRTRRGKKAGRKLVIIGDADTAASTLLHAVLAQEGIDCHVAENGVNTLALAKAKQADAVMVDVSLPGLDGFQVLAELKRDPAMSNTVTILLTARQAEADVLRGFGLGADDYITKPFSPMEVVARLKRFLLRKP